MTLRISHSPKNKRCPWVRLKDFSFPQKNKGYPWVQVVLTPSTVRLGVQDAKATEGQGSDDVFVTGSIRKVSDNARQNDSLLSGHTLQDGECVGWRRAVGEDCTSSRFGFGGFGGFGGQFRCAQAVLGRGWEVSQGKVRLPSDHAGQQPGPVCSGNFSSYVVCCHPKLLLWDTFLLESQWQLPFHSKHLSPFTKNLGRPK